MTKAVRSDTGKLAIRRGARSGMTLLEIMIGLALLVSISVAFLYSAMSTVRVNKMTELEIAGTNAIGAQLDTVIAASRDNRDVSHGAAKGLIWYLRDLRESISGGANTPIRVAWNGSEGTLVCEFPVPEPGQTASGVVTGSSTLADRQYDMGIGVMTVYLKENQVPAGFFEWDDMNEASDGSVILSSSGQTYFDMNADGESGGDFSNLVTGDKNAVYVGSDLSSLPVSITVRYYDSERYKNVDHDGVNVGFIDGNNSAVISLTRNYIINDTTVMRIGS